MSFYDSAQSFTNAVTSMPDSTFTQANTGNSSLGEFLSRPVKVQEYTWLHNAQFNNVFNPWTDFFSNAAVQKKLNNFSILRCKLVVRLQVNATKFHYGRGLMSYNPYGGVADNIIPGTISNFLVTRSQRPKVYFDPSTNMGGELVLPFVNTDNGILTTIQSGFDNMGQINLDTFVKLQSTSTTGDPVNISIWVHAIDVELAAPTSDDVFIPQGEEAGIVSGPANSVASAAGQLTKVPVIGPYAKATQMVASAVGSVAHFFGFSRHHIEEENAPVTPVPFDNAALTDAREGVKKLTFTSGAELTIDPRTVGLCDVDEMSIRSIATKESYVTNFPWKPSDVSGTILFGYLVNPKINALAAEGVDTTVAQTALSFASTPFNYWSGTIRIRFQIVANQFHRGRLRIVYDPAESGIFTNVDNFNVAFNHVIDIATNKDFTLDIPWMQYRPYMRNDLNPADGNKLVAPSLSSASRPDSAFASFGSAITDWLNGYLAVYVLNDLVGTGDDFNQEIEVMVSVSAGEDFEVAVPTSRDLSTFSYFKPTPAVQVFDPQGEEDTAELQEEGDFSPESEEGHTKVIAPTPSITDLKASVFFGERVVSYRALLKRYEYYCTHSLPGTAPPGSWKTFTLNCPFMPYFNGVDPAGRYGANTDNVVGTMLLTYLQGAYLGYRGSIRHKLLINSSGIVWNATVGRQVNVPNYSTAWTAGDTASAAACAAQRKTLLQGTGWEGTTLHAERTNAGVQIEFPYYRRARFSLARNKNVNAGLAVDSSDQDSQRININIPTGDGSGVPNEFYVDDFLAVGDDFSLFFYVGAPMVYYTP